MFDDWLAGELEALARVCPKTGDDVVRQIYQWRHELSRAWALALLGWAFAFIGTAALSLLKEELDVSSWATWLLVAAGAALVGAGGLSLRRLHRLLPEYLLAVYAYTSHRNSIHGEPIAS